eukprot:6131506-Pyramimonas_sp.AAC.3
MGRCTDGQTGWISQCMAWMSRQKALRVKKKVKSSAGADCWLRAGLHMCACGAGLSTDCR